jgi:hypothetical protein
MRTNEPGMSGRYSCDRCHQPSPRGVMTGCRPFEHVCLWCFGVWENLAKHPAAKHRTPLLASVDPWLTISAAEIAERADVSDAAKEVWAARR